MKVRIIKKQDNSISIIHPAIKSRRLDETEDKWLKRVFDKAIATQNFKGLDYIDIDASELPNSREYRNAWELKGDKISLNTAKVEEMDLKKSKN